MNITVYSYVWNVYGKAENIENSLDQQNQDKPTQSTTDIATDYTDVHTGEKREPPHSQTQARRVVIATFSRSGTMST